MRAAMRLAEKAAARAAARETAKAAEKQAAKAAAEEGAAEATPKDAARPAESDTVPCNSFVPATQVLLAGGKHKAIKDIKVGDKVLATDPKTGKTRTEPVIAAFGGTNYKKLIKITIDTGGKHGHHTGTITATEHHNFWNPTRHTWTRADHLTTGIKLRTPNGHTLSVITARRAPGHPIVRDLTIARYHTFYVEAGAQPILVHNCGGSVDFAHGTSLKHAESIRANGLSSGTARANANGGSLNKPGSFFTHRVTSSVDDGVQSAYEYGLRVDPESPSSVLVGRLPKSTYDDLVERGLVTTRNTGEGMPDETIFHPDSFDILNRDMNWLAILTP